MWLGVGCSDGKAKEAERPGWLCEPAGSQSPHSTDAVPVALMGVVRGTESINRAEGRLGRKVEA